MVAVRARAIGVTTTERTEMSTVFGGSTLLVTGGTGTFGNAVVRRMLRSDVAEIRIFRRGGPT
jgi:FlaA1/EpsC-like NDP-sugar epimerase